LVPGGSKNWKFFKGKMALEVIEAIEVAETAYVNEAAKAGKTQLWERRHSYITPVSLR
jgi:hypothetical protein